LVRGFILSSSTIVLLKVMPDCDDGMSLNKVGFLQAVNKHINRQLKRAIFFMNFERRL